MFGRTTLDGVTIGTGGATITIGEPTPRPMGPPPAEPWYKNKMLWIAGAAGLGLILFLRKK